MKYLRILNWLLFAASGATALVYFAVSLAVGLNSEQLAGVESHMPKLLFVTAIFFVFVLVSGVAAWLLHIGHKLMWAGQGVLLLAIAGMVCLSLSLSQI